MFAQLEDLFKGPLRDMRLALRQLRKSPGFTIAALLTLTIGIGVNTAVFSSMDAVVLRPLAVPQLNRVVKLAEQQGGGTNHWVALANYEDWARLSHSFSGLAVYKYADLSLTGPGDATHVEAAETSANFFSVLQAAPFLGRVFSESESETEPGADSTAVLSYGFWQRRFGGDASVLGRRIELDQRAYTIVGVMPKTVQYPSSSDLYLPLAPSPAQLANRSDHDYLVTGRLKDGVRVEQAQAEMRNLGTLLARDYPATNQGWSVHLEPLLDTINGDQTPLYYQLVMGATLFVLLVVCANVANLQFARGIARRPEIALRTALGASRWRLMRQLLAENLLLGLVGAAGGVGFAALYLHFILTTMPQRVARYIPGWANTSLNARALVFSLLLAALAGVAAGLAPALEALRVNLVDQLKAGSRSTTGSARTHRLRGVFATAQIALAVALVIGAALMAKGMTSLLHVADSLNPSRMLTFNVTLPESRYGAPRSQAAWYAQALQRLRALPGVQRAEISTALPYSGSGWVDGFEIESRPAMPGKFQAALRLFVSDGFFNTLHVPVLEGRGFASGDTFDSLPVAVVSRRFARQYFPNSNPLGQRIRLGAGRDSHDPWLTIVGVAEETQYSVWDQTPQLVVYTSVTQLPPLGATFALVTSGDPHALAEPARKALAAIDPALPLDGVETYDEYQREQLTGLIYVAVMLGVDAFIALLLAALGIFGVMANLVAERTREIGLRLALGARREDVLGMILGRAGRLTAAGIALGLGLAFALAHLAAKLFLGVRPGDPSVFLGITAVIAAIALVSSWIPARHAAHIDPMSALRDE